jgi:hypothetical protein
MNETIKSVIIETGETLIICRNMYEVKMMERHLKLNMYRPEDYIDSVGNVTFQFYDGDFCGWCHEKWYDEEGLPGIRKKIFYSAIAIPTFIEVDI